MGPAGSAGGLARRRSRSAAHGWQTTTRYSTRMTRTRTVQTRMQERRRAAIEGAERSGVGRRLQCGEARSLDRSPPTKGVRRKVGLSAPRYELDLPRRTASVARGSEGRGRLLLALIVARNLAPLSERAPRRPRRKGAGRFSVHLPKCSCASQACAQSRQRRWMLGRSG